LSRRERRPTKEALPSEAALVHRIRSMRAPIDIVEALLKPAGSTACWNRFSRAERLFELACWESTARSSRRIDRRSDARGSSIDRPMDHAGPRSKGPVGRP
ncbi:hypothetical protein ACS0Y6_36965, partial [Burkholderia gladioli]|uniref:hypothetical protein n=1 Tax=Burkholderia gladioli TaxID=28095 RepID=UPI003F7ADD46